MGAALDVQLRKTLTEIAYYAMSGSVSHSGDPSYGTATTFLCRTEPVSKYHGPNFMPRDGEELETFTIIFTEVNIGRDTAIWLPGVDHTKADLLRRPYRYDVMRDPEGRVSHYEIYV